MIFYVVFINTFMFNNKFPVYAQLLTHSAIHFLLLT